MHFILNRADEDVGIRARADFEGCGVGGEGGEEAGVDVFVDVETFDHHADLGAAEEGEDGELVICQLAGPRFLVLKVGYTFGIIASTSTSSQIIAGSFPPNSSVTRLSVGAAAAMTFLPVAIDPVKAILSISG